MKKLNESDITKQIEDFVLKSTLVILNSRIICPNISEMSINSNFVTREPQFQELGELFLDDYLQITTRRDISKHYIDIFFRRKVVKILIEKWSFMYIDQQKMIDTKTKRRLSVLLRTVYTMSRILPGFSLFMKKGFNFSLDYQFYLNLPKQQSFLSKTMKMQVGNLSSCLIEVEYLPKNEIFFLEEDIKIVELHLGNKERFIPDQTTTKLWTTFPSFEILIFEDISFHEDYFTHIRTQKNRKRLELKFDENTQFKFHQMSVSDWNGDKLNSNENLDEPQIEVVSLLDSFQSKVEDSNIEPVNVDYLNQDELAGFFTLSSLKKLKAKISGTMATMRKTSDTSSSPSHNSFLLDIQDVSILYFYFKEDSGQMKNIIQYSGISLDTSNTFQIDETIGKIQNLKVILSNHPTKINYCALIQVFSKVRKS